MRVYSFCNLREMGFDNVGTDIIWIPTASMVMEKSLDKLTSEIDAEPNKYRNLEIAEKITRHDDGWVFYRCKYERAVPIEFVEVENLEEFILSHTKDNNMAVLEHYGMLLFDDVSCDCD